MSSLVLTGIGKWMHRLFELDDFKGRKFWSMNLYPDPASLKVLKEGRFLLKIRKDEDGEFVVFRRYLLKPWKLKGLESPEFEPPYVAQANGDDWDKDQIIGNGSAVSVKIETFGSSNDGLGTRLEGVRVINWVEYKALEEEAGEDNEESIRPF